MKAFLVDDNVKFYAEPDDQTISIATLKKGDMVDIGKVTRKKKSVWVAVTLPSGQTGYMTGETKIFSIKQVQMMTNNEVMVDSVGEDAQTIRSVNKGEILTAVGIEKNEKDSWVRVKDKDGLEGFIRGNARIKLYVEPTKQDGKKLMLTGAFFAVLGVVFYFLSSTQADSATGTSLLMYVLIALGVVQIFQGSLQYRKAIKKEETGQKEPKEE